MNIPSYLQNFFANEEHQPTKTLSPLGPVDLSDTQQEDPIQRAQDETLQFLFPKRDLKYPPASPIEKDRDDLLADKGEFWVHRFGPKIQTGIEVNWDVISISEEAPNVIKRTIHLLKWMRSHLDPLDSQLKASRRKKAASILIELFELIFVIGTRFDVIRHDPLLMDGEEGSILQNQFTSELLSTINIIINQASNKETYVLFIGILQHPEIDLPGKLMCLEYFGQVLRSFTSKRAAHLVSANSMIYSALMKNGHILTRAGKSLSEVMDENDEDLCSRPVCYLEWLVGLAQYVHRYFVALGDAAAIKQNDDYHGVGPNSCASLLSKVRLTLEGLLYFIVRLFLYLGQHLHHIMMLKLRNLHGPHFLSRYLPLCPNGLHNWHH